MFGRELTEGRQLTRCLADSGETEESGDAPFGGHVTLVVD
jgi:hypothetical protein